MSGGHMLTTGASGSCWDDAPLAGDAIASVTTERSRRTHATRCAAAVVGHTTRALGVVRAHPQRLKRTSSATRTTPAAARRDGVSTAPGRSPPTPCSCARAWRVRRRARALSRRGNDGGEVSAWQRGECDAGVAFIRTYPITDGVRHRGEGIATRGRCARRWSWRCSWWGARQLRGD